MNRNTDGIDIFAVRFQRANTFGHHRFGFDIATVGGDFHGIALGNAKFIRQRLPDFHKLLWLQNRVQQRVFGPVVEVLGQTIGGSDIRELIGFTQCFGKGVKIPGVIGSVAPHALTEKQKQQPLSFDEMFIDIGANSREEVEKRGVEIGNFISPEANFACWGEDKVVGKALDNRIGCAMMAELLQTVNNPEITLYGVGSVEEEVGLRGAQTSAEHIKPDVVIVLDTAVAGDVPGIDNIKYPLKLGQGPGLMLFDKRYFPNQKLVAALKSCAAHNDLPLQFSTMKTGATDGGRYNVMGGGRPVVALCLPTRYLHANSGMISKADYEALLTLIRGFLTTLTAEKVNAFSQFRQVD